MTWRRFLVLLSGMSAGSGWAAAHVRGKSAGERRRLEGEAAKQAMREMLR